MTTTTFQEIQRQARSQGRRSNVLPLAFRFSADALTPSSAYARLRSKGDATFLFETVDNGERPARYTYLGCSPRETVTVRAGQAFIARGKALSGEPISALTRHLARYRSGHSQTGLGLAPFTGGAIGYLGYDCIRYIEPSVGAFDGLNEPASSAEGRISVYGTVVAFDQARSEIQVIGNIFTEDETLSSGYRRVLREIRSIAARLQSSARTGRFAGKAGRSTSRAVPWTAQPSLGSARYSAAVKVIKEHIRRGDIFQCVLSDRFEFPFRGDPFSIYRELRRVNPSPYLYFLEHPEEVLLGASPERLVKVEGKMAETHPIAGTRPRGETPAEDERMERDLLRSVKEKAEHLMLVDLGRNDLGKVCAPGSVRVTDLMRVERFSHVMHLVSTVQGKLGPGKTPWDALLACFPAGTLSGAPKIRAMQIIADLEEVRRGWYGGAIVRNSFDGDLDSCIAIRSLLVRKGVAYSQAGAGIVADSRPEREYEEVINKSKAMQRAVQLALTQNNKRRK